MQFTSADTSTGNATPQTTDSIALDYIGEAKHVLIVGGVASSLPQLLDSKGSELTFVLPSAVRSDEARVYSSHVEVANLDDVSVSDLFPDRKFDAIVLDAAVTNLATASRVLDDAHRMLNEQGRVVGLMPNVHHGAIRLALLKGLLAGDSFDAVAPELKRFTLEGVVRLFLQAGYDVEDIATVTHPIFEHSDLLPPLDRAEFSDSSVREVEADPDALTMQFVIRALPRADLSRDWTDELERVLTEARERTTQRTAEVLPFAPRDETPLDAELEGTRRQAALNAAAASRARLEVAGLQTQVEVLTSQLTESQDALQEQAAAATQAHAREGDMVARIYELEQMLETAAASSAIEIEAQTRDMVARIGELENLLLASQAETAKVRVRADAARASLERRNAYIGQLSAAQDATQTQLREANASAAGSQAQFAHANAIAQKRSATIDRLQSELAQSNDRANALTVTLSNRSRVIGKLEDARNAVQAQLDLANAALDAYSVRANALEISEAAARLELWVVRADLKARLVELEKRARTLIGEERANSARLEENLRRANDDVAAVVAEKKALQRAVDRSAEDLDALQSQLRTLEQDNHSIDKQHARALAQIESLKATNAEIPILTVRVIKSEKQAEIIENQLLEMTKRARGLEDDLLTAVNRELQLQRDAAALDEHARRVESDYQNATRRVEQTERDLNDVRLRSAFQEEQLTEAGQRSALQEERLKSALQQLQNLSDRLELLNDELLAGAGRERDLQHDAWRIGERARRLETDFKQSVHRTSQLEEELANVTRRSQQLNEELLEAARQSEQQAGRLADVSERCVQLEADVNETALQCAELRDKLAGTSERCEKLDGQLAEIHSSRMWKIASGLRRALKPWDRG